jgi:AraC-like DNA-binding protein
MQNKAWEDGRMAPILDIAEGATVIRDLKRNPSVLIDQSHHSLHFYIPRGALDMVSDEAEARRVSDLHYQSGVAFDDGIIRNIAAAVLAALRTPGEANRMFLDHVTMAVAIHVAHTYGGLVAGSRAARGGLSPLQERRAKELMCAHLDGGLGLEVIARACGISTSHFRRAFRQSTGMAPHQWLLQQRVEAAKVKLVDARLSLSEIALICGFADQSHFTRVFSQIAGEGPGRWRRERGIAARRNPSAGARREDRATTSDGR